MANFEMKLVAAGKPGPGVLDLMEIRNEIRRRLTKKEMYVVWSRLKRRDSVQEEYVLAQWCLMKTATKIPDEGATSADKALAMLFHHTVNIFSLSAHAWIRGEIEQTAEPLRFAADRCRTVAEELRATAQRHPHAGKWHAEHADAFSMVGDYFAEQWNLNAGPSPFIVDKYGDDPQTRTRVVALAAEMKRLYGTPLYAPTADIASAALGDTGIDGSPPVDVKKVRNWWASYADAESLPLPSKAPR
jgi:hypothetical protein